MFSPFVDLLISVTLDKVKACLSSPLDPEEIQTCPVDVKVTDTLFVSAKQSMNGFQKRCIVRP